MIFLNRRALETEVELLQMGGPFLKRLSDRLCEEFRCERIDRLGLVTAWRLVAREGATSEPGEAPDGGAGRARSRPQ